MYKKGESGNPGGRPVGMGAKLSNAKLAEYLAKGDKTALKTVLTLMQDSKQNGPTRLRAACSWFGFSKSMRDFIYKETQDKIKNEAEGNIHPEPEEDEDVDIPVVSRTALKSVK